MNVGEFKKALDSYPEDARLVLGISIPELYINTIANGSVTGDHVNPAECTRVQILATAPPKRHENTEQQRAVQEG